MAFDRSAPHRLDVVPDLLALLPSRELNLKRLRPGFFEAALSHRFAPALFLRRQEGGAAGVATTASSSVFSSPSSPA
ncbi:hypothetical protein [Sulfurifustis variabilis]|uniref:hypothetical protein n=1 Tax=Sulfurifustis variabilis TaxID=1675686 RepID=UPI0014755D2E|nr:hypothetical protein [Sulfurifustis variabilis]